MTALDVDLCCDAAVGAWPRVRRCKNRWRFEGTTLDGSIVRLCGVHAPVSVAIVAIFQGPNEPRRWMTVRRSEVTP